MKATYICPGITVLARQCADRGCLRAAGQSDDLLNLHLEFCSGQFAAVLVRELNLVELVLSDKDDVVMRYRVKLVGFVGWLDRVPARMEAGGSCQRECYDA